VPVRNVRLLGRVSWTRTLLIADEDQFCTVIVYLAGLPGRGLLELFNFKTRSVSATRIVAVRAGLNMPGVVTPTAAAGMVLVYVTGVLAAWVVAVKFTITAQDPPAGIVPPLRRTPRFIALTWRIDVVPPHVFETLVTKSPLDASALPIPSIGESSKVLTVKALVAELLSVIVTTPVWPLARDAGAKFLATLSGDVTVIFAVAFAAAEIPRSLLN